MTAFKTRMAQAYAAASTILASREAITSAWLQLLAPADDPTLWTTAIIDQLDAVIIGFAGYLVGEDLTDSPMANHWRDMRPSRALVADATVAMGMFPQALHQVMARVPNPSFNAAALMPAASCFVRDVILAILHSIQLEPDDQKWWGVTDELERLQLRRVARLGALTDIARAVSTADKPDDLFEQIHAACARIVNGDNFTIALYDSMTRWVTPRLVYLRGERRRDLEGHPADRTLCQIVAETQEPLAASDYLAACAQHGVAGSVPFAPTERVAWMAAPMIQGNQTVGVICVFNPLMPFSAEDVELLAGIARQTAVALENSRLINDQRRRARQLKAINQLARRIVTLRDPEVLLSTAVDLIHALFGYGRVSLFLADENDTELRLRAYSERASDAGLLDLRFPIGARSIVADVAATGQAALVNDVAQDPRYFSTPETADTRSEVAVPILREGRVLGVLDVQSPQGDAFDDHDLTTLRTIADQVAIALENARLFDEERERSQALALMLATTRAAGSSLVLDEVLRRLAEGIADAAGVGNCTIYLLDEDGLSLLPAATVVRPDSTLDAERLRSAVLRAEESPVIKQILAQDEPFVCCPVPRPLTVDGALSALTHDTAALAVPLAAKGRILGMALVVAEEHGGNFAPERVRVIRGVADSAALAIDNARLYARSHGLAVAEERGRLAQEIHDTLAQGLTAISLHLDLADAYLPTRPELAAEKVRRALELTRLNLEEARRSVLDLRAAHLHRVSLPDALRRLVQSFAGETGIETDFVAEGLSGRLSARVEIGLYRIAEEALTNVRRHAAAGRVHVRLTARERQVALLVRDDGAGFDQQVAPRDHGAGFGLVGIRERARLLRGTFELRAKPGEGTSLVVTVPFEGMMRANERKRGSAERSTPHG